MRHRLLTLVVAAGLAASTVFVGTPSGAAVGVAATAALASTPVAANGQLKIVGTQVQNQYGQAIQLRGMSTHGIQWYWQCVNNASMNALANDWQADVLRISMYVQEGGYETDPAGFTAKVNQAIQMVSDRGMYAVVDFHQLSPGDPNYNLANAKRFFTDIANANKNRNNIIYEIANEPNEVSWARIRDYAHAMIPLIRAIDGDAPILVGTHGWGSLGVSDGRNETDVINNPVNATNIAYTFHFYAASHDDEYLNTLDRASQRIPMWVSEFGTQQASGDGPNNFAQSQKYIDLMRNRKISWTNWNYSDDQRSGAVWNGGTCSSGDYSVGRLKEAGRWIRDRIATPDDFPGGGGGNPSSRLNAGAQLTGGQSLTSPNGRFRLTMQSDGNLVIYDNNAAIWATGTWNLPADRKPTRVDMQSDGNLVLYNNANQPAWASGSWGSGRVDPFLEMQDDGNLVIYHNGRAPLWASGTAR
ncbi:cellulase family glycosylhydrolase [Dactylosporangium cerinum]|uniref:cellulase n=1 Tax=Dactylosporangium cerinum TaxID=1434730 RepID=A0ABV9W348_9ACTN